MIVLAAVFVYASVCLEAARLPDQFQTEVDSCNSVYSCADCHTSRVCTPKADGKFLTIGTVQCPGDRPYCDFKSGSCVSERQYGCNAEPANDGNVTNYAICEKIYSCKDCHTAQICRPTANGSLDLLKTVPCSRTRPYCQSMSGTCVAEEPLECGTNSKFICIHDGKFPDADCNSYRLCQNLTDTAFECSQPNEHYNPKTGMCDAHVQCESFFCQGNKGRKVPHPLDPRYFAFCGSKEPIIIDSCHAPYELNITSQVCEAICHQNGLIQDIDDCHYYYSCTEVFITSTMMYFKKERKQCPNGQAFDPSQYLCVSDFSHIPECKL